MTKLDANAKRVLKLMLLLGSHYFQGSAAFAMLHYCLTIVSENRRGGGGGDDYLPLPNVPIQWKCNSLCCFVSKKPELSANCVSQFWPECRFSILCHEKITIYSNLLCLFHH